MNTIVIDLETLDTEPTAAILSIGMVIFDIDKNDIDADYLETPDTQLWRVKLTDQLLEHGRTVSLDTLEWWSKQANEVKCAALHEGEELNLEQVLRELTNYKGYKFYFRGTDFDGSILEHAFKQMGIKCPWKYNAKRDIRTHIDAIMGTEKGYIESMERPEWITAHRADHDAAWDAIQLQTAQRFKRENLTVTTQEKN